MTVVFASVTLPKEEVVLLAATEVLPIVIGKPVDADALLVWIAPKDRELGFKPITNVKPAW